MVRVRDGEHAGLARHRPLRFPARASCDRLALDPRDGPGRCLRAALPPSRRRPSASRISSPRRGTEHCGGHPPRRCRPGRTSPGSRRTRRATPPRRTARGRTGARRRGGVLTRSALPGDRLHAGCANRCEDAHRADAPQRAGDRAHLRQQRDQRDPGRRPHPGRLAGTRERSGTALVEIRATDWPTGVYAARLAADDGRVGFAPIVVRPGRHPGHASRWASPRAPGVRTTSMTPTATAGVTRGTPVGDHACGPDATPHATRGVPYRYRSYDLAFQHWLAQTGKSATSMPTRISSSFASPRCTARRLRPDRLPWAYRVRDEAAVRPTVQVYRDLGGILLFLSANNFFRRVDRRDHVLTARWDEWRGSRPPGGLLGSIEFSPTTAASGAAPFTVVGADVASTVGVRQGTGLGNGSTFGLSTGSRWTARPDRRSPPQTQVACDLFRISFGPLAGPPR